LSVGNFIVTKDKKVYKILDTGYLDKYITVSHYKDNSNPIKISVVTGEEFRSIRDNLPSMPKISKTGGKRSRKTRQVRKPKRKNGSKSRKH